MVTKLKSVNLSRLHIPFRTGFKHAAAERSVSESVIATVESRQGVRGVGEGCPRRYVTGETLESCEQFVADHCAELLSLDSVNALREWTVVQRAAIDQNPAAWCAIETACLDLFGKVAGCSIERLLGLSPPMGSYRYSAVLGAPNEAAFTAQLDQYCRLGMRDFKLKVCGDISADRAHIEAIAGIGHTTLRLDANNLWGDAADAISYLEPFCGRFWAVEEPLVNNDRFQQLAVGDALGCKIILDESMCTINDIDGLQREPDRWVPNIRLSKMGGLVRSVAVAKRCSELGLKFVIGAQVGETSILTRLALALAAQAGGSLIAQEGAFGTYLLAHDVTDSPLMFGALGELAAPLDGPGLGISCDFS